MESIKDLLPKSMTPKSGGHKTNKFWLIAEDIAKATDTRPNRWLRLVKNKEHACLRALDTIKEVSPRNPVAYFIFLTNSVYS